MPRHAAFIITFLLVSSGVRGDSYVTINFTQDGGVLPNDPPTLVIGSASGPTLTMINEATASWTGATIVGNLSGAPGNFHILSGSTVSNNTGTGDLIGSYGGTNVYRGEGYIGLNAGSEGTALVSGAGSSWTNGEGLYIGFKGAGELTVDAGGSVSSGSVLSIGQEGEGELIIASGGLVTSASAAMAIEVDGRAKVLITGAGSSWTIGGELTASTYGLTELTVENGGYLSSENSLFGDEGTGEATVIVTGMGSIWNNTGDLTLGFFGYYNTLTVADEGLVMVGGDLFISRAELVADFNYLQLAGGFFAWEGDNTDAVEDFLFAGEIRVWDAVNEEWVDATSTVGETLFEYAYFATDEEALAFTGYEGLGGYTILTSTVVPEPGQFAAIAGLLGLLLALRRRRR